MNIGGRSSSGPLGRVRHLGTLLGGMSPKRAGIVTVMVAAVLGPVVVPTAAQAAGPPAARPGDGTTAETAGASCWGIKQRFSQSATGVYWLRTKTLVAPEKFTCDMTTDGGGWALIGVGREGWTWSPAAQGLSLIHI